MFRNLHLAQYLLVDNTMASLKDIRVIANISHYCTTVIEESIQCQAVAYAKATLCCTREKKLSSESYLFHACIPTCIHHLILDLTQPPSSIILSSTPTLVASQGPDNTLYEL
jgi:hypothetical protein